MGEVSGELLSSGQKPAQIQHRHFHHHGHADSPSLSKSDVVGICLITMAGVALLVAAIFGLVHWINKRNHRRHRDLMAAETTATEPSSSLRLPPEPRPEPPLIRLRVESEASGTPATLNLTIAPTLPPPASIQPPRPKPLRSPATFPCISPTYSTTSSDDTPPRPSSPESQPPPPNAA